MDQLRTLEAQEQSLGPNESTESEGGSEDVHDHHRSGGRQDDSKNGGGQKTQSRSWVRWTQEEHDKLTRLVEELGVNRSWSAIAAQIPGRTGKQCRERWLNHTSADTKKGNWSSKEEYILASEHSMHGSQWCRITRQLPGRTDNSVKNHWNATWRSKVMHKPQSILWLYSQEVKAGLNPAAALKAALLKWENNVPAHQVVETLGFWPSQQYGGGSGAKAMPKRETASNNGAMAPGPVQQQDVVMLSDQMPSNMQLVAAMPQQVQQLPQQQQLSGSYASQQQLVAMPGFNGQTVLVDMGNGEVCSPGQLMALQQQGPNGPQLTLVRQVKMEQLPQQGNEERSTAGNTTPMTAADGLLHGNSMLAAAQQQLQQQGCTQVTSVPGHPVAMAMAGPRASQQKLQPAATNSQSQPQQVAGGVSGEHLQARGSVETHTSHKTPASHNSTVTPAGDLLRSGGGSDPASPSHAQTEQQVVFTTQGGAGPASMTPQLMLNGQRLQLVSSLPMPGLSGQQQSQMVAVQASSAGNGGGMLGGNTPAPVQSAVMPQQQMMWSNGMNGPQLMTATAVPASSDWLTSPGMGGGGSGMPQLVLIQGPGGTMQAVHMVMPQVVQLPGPQMMPQGMLMGGQMGLPPGAMVQLQQGQPMMTLAGPGMMGGGMPQVMLQGGGMPQEQQPQQLQVPPAGQQLQGMMHMEGMGQEVSSRLQATGGATVTMDPATFASGGTITLPNGMQVMLAPQQMVQELPAGPGMAMTSSVPMPALQQQQAPQVVVAPAEQPAPPAVGPTISLGNGRTITLTDPMQQQALLKHLLAQQGINAVLQ